MKLALSLMAGAALAVASASAVQAADLLRPVPADPIYSSSLFNFDGFYVGGTAGLASYASTGYGSVGVVVGSNFAVTDGIVIGGEFQGDIYFNGGISAFDALALGRVGGFIADNIMLYGDVGAGIVDTTPGLRARPRCRNGSRRQPRRARRGPDARAISPRRRVPAAPRSASCGT